ncbi:hypothetical protein [uncultured Pelagimonas sp.]|uniref:hypothetical protein n=1 Tax=uncultured Pelagimonas sp. TaxID=1618102 RepID=UPI002610140E|nr:hypothetical protein [uncultured Pelagimonas sp.]
MKKKRFTSAASAHSSVLGPISAGPFIESFSPAMGSTLTGFEQIVITLNEPVGSLGFSVYVDGSPVGVGTSYTHQGGGIQIITLTPFTAWTPGSTIEFNLLSTTVSLAGVFKNATETLNFVGG